MRKHRLALTGATVLSGLMLAGLTAAPPRAARAAETASCPWVTSTASPAARADQVLAQMTLDEKLHMMAGTAHPAGVQTNGYIAPIPRLCVPALTMIGGPAGLHYNGSNKNPPAATALPAPIALAASFDPKLAEQYGEVIGQEARAQGQDNLFGPMVNIDRVPQSGRTFETFSEDPLLSAEMGVSEIRAIQAQGVAANVKHYVANNQEKNRKVLNAVVGERTLREIYLPAFEAAVKQGDVASVMCAYNQVNGAFNCENQPLLGGVLKGDWGFDGVVLSDYPATHSTVASANAGLDIELPRRHYYSPDALTEALQAGEVSMATIDDHARRVLTLMFRFGLFDRADASGSIPVVQHGDVARRVAEDSMVLLQNRESALPLDAATLHSIAVIGPYAAAAKTGGGGSSHVDPFYTVTPVQGIKQRVGDGVTVRYARGTDDGGLQAIPSAALSPPARPGVSGLRADYFANPDLAGQPALTRIDDAVDFDWGQGAPAPGLPTDGFSVRWTGTLTAPTTGTYTFAATSDDGSRIYLGGRLLVDNWGNHGSRTETATVELTAGQHYQLRVDYFDNKGAASVTAGWRVPGDDSTPLQQAVTAAKSSDVAIVMVGDDRKENVDQQSIALSDAQNQLVEAVAAANPNTIVVVKSGGPVLLPWADQVKAVLEAWYPGEEDGAAVAGVLFGDVNPSGKLPVTFPASEAATPLQTAAQYPGVDDQVTYSEGLQVGYRWYDAHHVAPAYPFGFGLSYTTFRVHDLSVSPGASSPAGPFTVHAQVTNTGTRAGAETVQLYVDYPDSAGEPPHQLRGFQKVSLRPGQTRQVTFHVDRRALSYWDTTAHGWTEPTGTFRFHVGTSSADLPLQQAVQVTGLPRG